MLSKIGKVGRNAPCPCGSGEKFKRCHGGSDNVPGMKPGQLDSQLKRLAPRAVCLVPETMKDSCQGRVIASHTVSRSGSLGAIERKGHVYSYLMSIKRFDDLGGGIKPRLVGWKDASTFPGFCGHHDKKLFAPLEDEPFTGSPQQCFLLSYRAIVWEYYAKLRSNGSASMRVALAAQKSSSVQRQAMDINRQTDLGLRDMQVRKNKFDECLTAGSWGDLHGLLIEFDQLFPIQCSAAWSPLIDVYGEKLQVLDYSPRTPAGAALVSFAANGNSYFLLS